MRRFLISMTVMLLCGLIAGCGTAEDDTKIDPNYEPRPSDRLTKSELQMLISQAQQFVSSPESNKSRMTAQQRQYVRTTRPAVEERYWGPKTGYLEMRWRLSPNSELIIRSRGKLLKKKPNWEMEIYVTKESSPLPAGFLSRELENQLALPPK